MKITRIRYELVKRFGKDININEKLTDFYEQIIHHKIENYFSMMKSRLHKLEGLTYDDLKQNIDKVIKETPKGIYQRPTKFIRKKKSNRTRKLKNYF